MMDSKTWADAHKDLPEYQKAPDGRDSDLSALLSAIDAAEAELWEKRRVLRELQHKYLSAVGFTIEQEQGCWEGELVYRLGDESFIDVDHAMEYAE